MSKSAEAFERESGLVGEEVPRSSGLLEKKWTSIVRLQKKVMELEERLQAAEQELKAFRACGGTVGVLASARDNVAGSRNLPRAPASKVLVGHRGGITCLTAHPIFGLLVSGSEDATIKVRLEKDNQAHDEIPNS